MQTQILPVLFLTLLSSCSIFKDPPCPPTREPLKVVATAPIDLEDISWNIITEENYKLLLGDLKTRGVLPVLFAVDEKSLQNIIVNDGKIKGYIDQQQQIIISYESYYNPKGK